MSLLNDEIRALVGRQVRYTAPEPLGRASIRYFARAVGDDNPVYTDPEAARQAGHRDVVAPPTFVCETNQYADGRPDDDGYVGHAWDIPVPEETRLVRGGHEYEFHAPVYPDAVVTATWTVEDVEEKTSRAGGALLLVTSLAEFHDQHGQLLARNRETLIYQEVRP